MRWPWQKLPEIAPEDIEQQLGRGTGRVKAERVPSDTRRRYAEQPKPDNGDEEH